MPDKIGLGTASIGKTSNCIYQNIYPVLASIPTDDFYSGFSSNNLKERLATRITAVQNGDRMLGRITRH